MKGNIVFEHSCKNIYMWNGKKLKPKKLKSGLLVCPLCNEKLEGKVKFANPAEGEKE